eukprot:6200504-Pleurochrysis_carterae.AAC.4
MNYADDGSDRSIGENSDEDSFNEEGEVEADAKTRTAMTEMMLSGTGRQRKHTASFGTTRSSQKA